MSYGCPRRLAAPERKLAFSVKIAVGDDGGAVAKSRTFESAAGKVSAKVIYATRADKSAPSLRLPWTAQKHVEGERRRDGGFRSPSNSVHASPDLNFGGKARRRHAAAARGGWRSRRPSPGRRRAVCAVSVGC